MHISSDKQIRLTSATEILTSLTQSSYHSFCIDKALTEILSSIGALKFLSHGSIINILVNCIQFIISPDRTDLVWEDLLRVTLRTIITQHSSNS